MATALFDGDGLRDFVAAGEWSPPPVFVGRTEAIADIEAAARRAWKPGAASHGEPKATRILHGAPGAGKSSILAELAARCGASRGAGAPRILLLNSVHFADISAVYRSLASAVNHREAERLFESARRELSAGGALKLLGSGVDGGLDRDRAQGAPVPTMSAFAEWVSGWTGPDSTQASPWNFPLIVAIDEAQRLPPGDRTPAAYFVQTIHEATKGLPLTLVLAGLGDTQDRAQKMGLTRGLKLYEVGRLSVEETDELMRGFCRRFGLRADGSEPFLAELAAGAEGWPRHLHFALQALGEEALAADGDLGRVSWSAAAKRAAESRLRYYRAQQSNEMEDATPLIAMALGKMGEQSSRFKLKRLLAKLAAEHPDASLPAGMTVDSFYDHLTHRGALQERADASVHCPIPSFRSFLIEEGKKALGFDPLRARPPESKDPGDSPSPY